MKSTFLVLGLVGAALVAVAPMPAHHSFAATYFEDKKETIQGTIAQFQFRNPHSFVLVDVKGIDGSIVKYGVEWGGGGQLGRQGITRETLKTGDPVIVVGNPGRTPEDHRLRMLNITRTSDGWKWGGSFD